MGAPLAPAPRPALANERTNNECSLTATDKLKLASQREEEITSVDIVTMTPRRAHRPANAEQLMGRVEDHSS
eukprot:5792668-Pyramimonas_sp.AAC.1